MNVNRRNIKIKYLQAYVTLTLLVVRQHKNLQNFEVLHPTENNFTSLCDGKKTHQKIKKNSVCRGTSAYDGFICAGRIKLQPLVNTIFRHCPLKLKVRLL